MSSTAAPTEKPKASFLAFFLVWAELKRWDVPDVHVRAVHWLEHRSELAVLRCFRGFGKSTLLATYNAWRFWVDPTYRILHQGDQDRTAFKTSRDTKAVLKRHPWTAEWFSKGARGESAFWWCPNADDERNPSMQAAGITSGITSSRCDEAQNDDVEVPKNITNPELREKMRDRLGEQIHIAVPGARFLFVGTPHTHDSLYDEQERLGADCLTIKMFEREHRVEHADGLSYPVPFEPEFVFFGIGEKSRILHEGKDYTVDAGRVVFKKAPGGLVDFYAGSAWPERFTIGEMVKRRRKCRTINEWDSQYQLHSKPLNQTRLDPDRMIPYEVEPKLLTYRGETRLMLGRVRIVSASMRWDPSTAKLNSDVSALCLMLQDEKGNNYWHRAISLTGDIAKLDAEGKIVGGQVWQICDVVDELSVPRVTIETNGLGETAPALLTAALNRRGIRCGVEGMKTTGNKNLLILEAFDAPLSGGYLWAHTSVIDVVAPQMRPWNPAVKDQPDDFLDAGGAALRDEPVRIGHLVGIPTADPRQDWRPEAGSAEVEVVYAD